MTGVAALLTLIRAEGLFFLLCWDRKGVNKKTEGRLSGGDST